METKKTTSYKIPLIILSVLLAVTIGVLIAIWVRYGAVQEKPEHYEATTYAMGTYVQQVIYGSDSSAGAEAASAANQAVVELEDLISWKKENSDIQNLNNQAGKGAVTLDEKTIRVLQDALDVAKKSNGAYDPTILPLSLLWNFDEDTKIVPAKSEIQTHLKNVGYKKLSIDAEKSTAELTSEHAAIDLGSIGKGAACDVALESYAESGVSSASIAVGGSVGVYGTKEDGSKWTISLRNPRSGEDTTASMGIISIDSGVVSTSGTYEKTFEQDGVTYHHILDPKTGYPADSDLISVTVHCENGALSDALATACIVLGLEDGQKLLDQYDAGGIFITNENKVIVTGDLVGALEITSDTFSFQE